jgi:hypothetical protein
MTGSKLISFSLFGDDPTYTVGALQNVELYRELLPDYTCVFFCGPSVPSYIKSDLLREGAEVREIDGREDWGATMWRFLILNDWESFSHVIFRDCDSRPSSREVAAVRSWEASGKGVHVMNDHPAHGATVLAGMWGCTGSVASHLSAEVPLVSGIRMSNDYHEHIDQGWLEIYVGPYIRADGLRHASFWKTFYGPSEPFPTERVGNEFVGAAFKADGTSRYPDHEDIYNLCNSCMCVIKCDKS